MNLPKVPYNCAFATAIIKRILTNMTTENNAAKKNQRTEKNEKGEFGEEIHETIARLTLFKSSIYIMKVLVSSLVHRENLIKAMITEGKELI